MPTLNIGDFVYFDSKAISVKEAEWKCTENFTKGEWVILDKPPEEIIMGKCTYQGMWLKAEERENTESVFSLFSPAQPSVSDGTAVGYIFFHQALKRRFLVTDPEIKIIPASLLDEQPQV